MKLKLTGLLAVIAATAQDTPSRAKEACEQNDSKIKFLEQVVTLFY